MIRLGAIGPMPTYIFRLIADSCVRLSETPYIDANSKSFCLALPEFGTIAAFDNVIDLGGVAVPRGLVMNVQLDADDFNSGVGHAQEAAIYFLSMLSCVTNASLFRPKVLWGYDATPGLADREFKVFTYDTNLHLSSRSLNMDSLLAWLDKKLNGFMASETIKQDWKDRLARAVRSFRRGLADTEDVLDEFLVHWSSLETLEPVYKSLFGLASEYISPTCSACKTKFAACPVCQEANGIVIAQRQMGIEEVFAVLEQPEKYNVLRKLRNGISHGYKDLGECIKTASENIELVRKA